MLDLAYRYKAVTAAISIGKFDREHEGVWHSDAERFYVLYQPNDTSVFRVGRVLPAYGLNIADHVSPTRSPLGFGIASERDSIEYHFIGETWNAAIGTAQGPKDSVTLQEERSVYGQVSRALSEKHKIGFSVWNGESDLFQRRMAGVFAALGFTPHFYLVSEVDSQWLTPSGGSETPGVFGYHKLGYEFKKGMHIFATADHAKSNLNDDKTFVRHWGGGLQFFPRPHFEISGVWTRELKKSISEQEGDYAWLLLHYYL
jgi:hypothetical protein